MQRGFWVIWVGILLSAAAFGKAKKSFPPLTPQDYTSCTCGVAPSSPGYCRFTGVKRLDGALHFEDRKSFARDGGCDFQTCGRLFYRDYGPKCESYLPGLETLPPASAMLREPDAELPQKPREGE